MNSSASPPRPAQDADAWPLALRALREDGASSREIAEAIGIHPRTVARLEAGAHTGPHLTTRRGIVALARARGLLLPAARGG